MIFSTCTEPKLAGIHPAFVQLRLRYVMHGALPSHPYAPSKYGDSDSFIDSFITKDSELCVYCHYYDND